MYAVGDDDKRTLVESARDEALIEIRRRNLEVNCEPWVSNSWSGERLDVPVLGLLTRVMGVASWSHTTCSGVSLEHDPAQG